MTALPTIGFSRNAKILRPEPGGTYGTTSAVVIYGWAGWIAKYILYFALRAALRASRFAPGKFVEPVVLILRASRRRNLR